VRTPWIEAKGLVTQRSTFNLKNAPAAHWINRNGL